MTQKANQISEALKAILHRGATPMEFGPEQDLSFEEIFRLTETDELPRLGDLQNYPYIVAVRRRGDTWPMCKDMAIRAAKRRCDEGWVNLTYYHGPTHLVMYAFPRQVRERRKPWFFGDMGA